MSDRLTSIYSYTSKLLHATPISLTTNQKNLAESEIKIFLKYIYIRLLDVIKIVEKLLLTTNANT